MKTAPLLIEIGCEEIPARVIPAAAGDLRGRLARILDQADLTRGAATAWGGSRRLAARVDDVQARQVDRVELVVGPPAKLAFDADGHPTPAARGFASKQGIDPSRLERVENEKGAYAGFQREVRGLTVGELLARELPAAVEGMSFPKTMRWGKGHRRWVRPVQWLLALHGKQVLPIELFGVRAGNSSVGHRFLSRGPVKISNPDRYHESLRKAHVIVDPAERRARLEEKLRRTADQAGGRLVEDPALLEETADLVEWPQVIEGRLEEQYLELPRELLVTTLRHHQKCFSVEDPEGRLLPAFLAVANMESDPAGHIQRGNEWVVGGRLEDARFFWHEDRKVTLASRGEGLKGVVFHAKAGSYAEKSERVALLAGDVAARAGLREQDVDAARRAAALAKNDLLTGTVGEFPELQGIVGGLLLQAEGHPTAVARGVYEHYRPLGPDDAIPDSPAGCAVSVADKLDSISQLIRLGQVPSGSRDPFGLRRASNGIFRILIAHEWPLSLNDGWQLSVLDTNSGPDERTLQFLAERFRSYLKQQGWSTNEILAVLRPKVSSTDSIHWHLHDVVSRLEAIGTVRRRDDFAHLVDLTKRVDNILVKGSGIITAALEKAGDPSGFEEGAAAALQLKTMIDDRSAEVSRSAEQKEYRKVIDVLAEFVQPVDRFFDDVLVLDPDNPQATLSRQELLVQLRGVLTRCFDIRELAGQADRRA